MWNALTPLASSVGNLLTLRQVLFLCYDQYNLIEGFYFFILRHSMDTVWVQYNSPIDASIIRFLVQYSYY